MRKRSILSRSCGLRISLLLVVAALAARLAEIAVGQTPQSPAVQPAPAQSVVDSPEWQATRQAFQQWLTVQQVYTDQEMQAMVNDLRTRVAAMNEQERAAFLKDMQSRLAVLNSEQAVQARAWMSENMSRMTPAGQQKLRRQIPDVANMSAAQLQQALASKQMQMQGRQQSQAATAQFRTQQNQMAIQMNQQRQQAFTDARQRQQNAVSSQATNRVQQGFQQSQQNSRNNIGTPGGNAPLFNPFIWANPWVY
ncbi:MAG: hypothetical protein WD468_07465 [Pirellulales bacterium]